MNTPLLLLTGLTIVAWFVGIHLAKWIDEIKEYPWTFVIALAISGTIGFGITYFIINGIPPQGFVEFFGNYFALLAFGAMATVIGAIYFFSMFKAAYCFALASMLLGLSITIFVYHHSYWPLIITAISLTSGFLFKKLLIQLTKNC